MCLLELHRFCCLSDFVYLSFYLNHFLDLSVIQRMIKYLITLLIPKIFFSTKYSCKNNLCLIRTSNLSILSHTAFLVPKITQNMRVIIYNIRVIVADHDIILDLYRILYNKYHQRLVIIK